MEDKNIGEFAKDKIIRFGEIVTEDPVGDLMIATAVVAAHLDFYPLAAGAFAGGIYHINETDKLQKRKERLLKKAKDSPRLLKRLDDVHLRLEDGNLSDKYTAWLYKRLRNKVLSENN